MRPLRISIWHKLPICRMWTALPKSTGQGRPHAANRQFVDGLAQINRATRNTFYGMLLPNAIIPSLDGSPVNNLGSVWDSGAGLLVSWQPFDLGLRKANVDIARAEKGYAQASLNLTRFEVAVATADAFLTVIAAEQTQRAAQAAVNSWEVLLHNIHAIVYAQLRPAADESR